MYDQIRVFLFCVLDCCVCTIMLVLFILKHGFSLRNDGPDIQELFFDRGKKSC